MQAGETSHNWWGTLPRTWAPRKQNDVYDHPHAPAVPLLHASPVETLSGPQGSMNGVGCSAACVGPCAGWGCTLIKLAPDSDCPAGKCTSPKVKQAKRSQAMKVCPWHIREPWGNTTAPSQAYEKQVENAGHGQEATSVPISDKVGK